MDRSGESMNPKDKHADWLLKPTANELADIQAFKTEELTIWERNTTATMLRQQQAEINQQQDEKKALYNLVAEQDKKIVELAFKLAYAERGNEIVLEANTRSRP